MYLVYFRARDGINIASCKANKLGMLGVSDKTEKTDTFVTDKALSAHR